MIECYYYCSFSALVMPLVLVKEEVGVFQQMVRVSIRRKSLNFQI